MVLSRLGGHLSALEDSLMFVRRSLLLAAIVGLASSMPVFAQEHTTDSLDVVKAQTDKGEAVLLDVRELDEWNKGHVEGAKHLPFRSKIQQGITKEELEKVVPTGKVIYTHCGMGRRALAAAKELKKHGYDVRPLKPGYEDLIKEHFKQAKKEE
jgi:phage shock protein E